MEHTPGLWKIENNGELQELDGVQYVRIMGPGEYEHICDIFETPALPSYPNVKVDARANAEFIVRACNAHDELVDTCNLILERMDLGRVVARGENRVKSYEIKGKRNEDVRDIIKTFKQALAKAERKEV